MNDFRDLIYNQDSLKNDKFVFCEDVKKIRVDIGLAGDGTHGCEWLLANNDVGVIGIEANPTCREQLVFGGSTNSYLNSLYLFRNKICKFVGYISEVYLKREILGLDLTKLENVSAHPPEKFVSNNILYHFSPRMTLDHTGNFRMYPILQEIKDISEKYILLAGAVDNIENEIIYQSFFSTPKNLGTSSLRKDILVDFPEKGDFTEIKVPSYSLDSVLERVDWDKFPFIECIKIDVEGKELDVLKSCKKHIDRVVFFRLEVFEGRPECADDARSVLNFMKEADFHLFGREPGDYKFVNRKYLSLIEQQHHTNPLSW